MCGNGYNWARLGDSWSVILYLADDWMMYQLGSQPNEDTSKEGKGMEEYVGVSTVS